LTIIPPPHSTHSAKPRIAKPLPVCVPFESLICRIATIAKMIPTTGTTSSGHPANANPLASPSSAATTASGFTAT
jgi:hypothetical protein